MNYSQKKHFGFKESIKLIFIVMLTGFICLPLFSQNTTINEALFRINENKLADQYQEDVRQATFLDINQASLTNLIRLKKKDLSLLIPVKGKENLELELTQVQVLTPDFSIKTSDGQGKNKLQEAVIFYHGTIKGVPESSVAVSLYEGTFKALITTNKGNYVLNELPNQTGKYVFYNDKDLSKKNSFDCGTNDKHHLSGESIISEITEVQRMTNCVEIYIECDYAMYQAHGSDITNVENFVTSLLNEVALLYSNENITIQLSEIFVWTTSDPYAGLTNTLAILEKFGEERQDNYDGRLAHLLSTRNLGGGIAWVDVLCHNYHTFEADFDEDGIDETHHAGPYAFSGDMSTTITPFPTYSWNVSVFAHEMGHNFGSPHTQKCSWGPNSDAALDDCVATEGGCAPGPTPTSGGTIMSYCHTNPNIGINFNNGFGQEPGDLLRSKYNNATCDLSCAPSCLLNPSDLSICATNTSGGSNNGSLTAMMLGGNTGFSFDWSNGATGSVINNLALGTYTVTVSDGTCSLVQSAIVGFVEAPVIEWEMNYGGSSHDDATCIAPTQDGGFIVGGKTQSTDIDLSNNNGNYDAWVFKIDQMGTVQWSKNFGTGAADEVNSVKQGNDGNYYVAGRYNGNSEWWVAKLDNLGNIIWQQNFVSTPTQSNIAYSLEVTADNGCIVTGQWNTYNARVVKLDTNGNLEWSKDYNEMHKAKMSQNKDGTYILSGHYGSSTTSLVKLKKLDTIGNIIWEQEYPYSATIFGLTTVFQTKDGGFILSSGSNTEGWIIKVDTNGILEWSRTYGGSNLETIYGITPLDDGNHLVIGTSQSDDGDLSDNYGLSDIWVFKIDAQGNIIWSQNYGSNHIDDGTMAIPTSDGGFIFSGLVTVNSNNDVSNNYGSSDAWVVKLKAPESNIEPLTFIVNDICESTNSTISIPVSVENFTSVNGFQYSVHIDPAFATITGVDNFGLAGWGAGDFTIYTNTGTITVTREAADVSFGESVNDETVIFTIEATVIADAGTNSIAFIDGNPTPVEALQNLAIITPVLEQGTLCVTPEVSISGMIYTYDNQMISNAELDVTGDWSDLTGTDATGEYQIANIPGGSSIVVTPFKEVDTGNGVSIADVVDIKLHILQIQPLDNPYKIIAADTNGDDVVSTIDLVFIKRVIRQEVFEFPIEKSWRFVPHDYVFPTPTQPFPFPENRDYDLIGTEYNTEHFIGIKIGDVNGSVDPSL